jgi:hypothetical protein
LQSSAERRALTVAVIGVDDGSLTQLANGSGDVSRLITEYNDYFGEARGNCIADDVTKEWFAE